MAATSPWVSTLSSLALTYAAPTLPVRTVLGALYRCFPGFKPAPSHPGVVHAILVSLFLCYSLLSTFLGLPVHFYSLLGVPACNPSHYSHEAWKETVLRPRWLSLVRTYHPDKLGGSDEAQAYFRSLQQANEVLKSDHLRIAYEKFGPSFVKELPATPMTSKEMLVKGGMASIGWYIVATVIFIILPCLGNNRDKKLFWRVATLVLLASSEVSLLTSPTTLFSLLTQPTMVAYEAVALLRQTWILLNIALTQLPIRSAKDNFDDSPDRLASQAAPLIRSMALRTDFTSAAVDQLLREQVRSKSSTDADGFLLLDRVVDTMARL